MMGMLDYNSHNDGEIDDDDDDNALILLSTAVMGVPEILDFTM